MRRASIPGAVAVLALVAACAAPAGSPAPATGGSGSPTPAGGGRATTVASPAEGLIVRIASEGLTKVTGFRLRTEDGSELELRIGVLENGVEFPPGHLAEHMATTSPIRAFFREEGGERVVYRLEDAE